jgi:hypothetical protein
MSKSSKPGKRVVRKDAVKEMDGGWYGVTGHGDSVRRMFRTKEEATIADGLLLAAAEPAPQRTKK